MRNFIKEIVNNMNNVNISHPYPIFLEGEKIYFRPFLKTDIKEEYLAWLNNPKLTLYSSTFRTWPTTEHDLAIFYNDLKSIDHVIFAVCIKENHKHIGNASIDNIDWINRRADHNMMIGDPKYRTVSYLDILQLLMKYAFQTLNLNKLCGGTEIPGITELQQRIGWKKEGILLKHNYRNGEYVDVTLMAVHKDNYLNNFI